MEDTKLRGDQQTPEGASAAPEIERDQPDEQKQSPASGEETGALKEKVVEAVSTCYDPEIPVNIYELGLIYDISVNPASEVTVRMTLTSPACPAAQSLPGEVEDKIRLMAKPKDVKVEVVWDPPWSPDMMSEAARLQLGMM